MLAVAAVLSLAGTSEAAVNLVKNGSFEQYTWQSVPIGTTGGSFTGSQPDDWDVKFAFGEDHAFVNAFAANAYDGSASYRFVPVFSPVPDELSQVIPTEPGVEYTLSFALRLDTTTPTNQISGFSAGWGTGGVTFSSNNFHPFLGQYSVVTANFIGGPGDTTTLSFQGLSINHSWFLDDVSVVETSAVPEPATAGLLALAAGVLLRRRRGARRAAGNGKRRTEAGHH